MKKLNRIQINSDKLINDNELISLRGGAGSYQCYAIGWMPNGWCDGFKGYINTASCDMAWTICNDLYGGTCVCGGDCQNQC